MNPPSILNEEPTSVQSRTHDGIMAQLAQGQMEPHTNTPASGTSAASLLGPLNQVEAKFAPKVLFAAGDRGLLAGTTRVAIVGTREPSEAGRRRATRLAKLLVREEVVVVSGLAQGIDRVAHETAMYEGGRTIAVIGTPLERAYPAAHKELQAKIAGEHLVISQFPSGSKTFPSSFIQRNRTMALISHATVIVEAGEASGTISQGWEAIRLGRELFLAKSLVETPGLLWPAELCRYGARVLAEPEDILDLLPAGVLPADLDAI